MPRTVLIRPLENPASTGTPETRINAHVNPSTVATISAQMKTWTVITAPCISSGVNSTRSFHANADTRFYREPATSGSTSRGSCRSCRRP
jgi:hypothetical protein